MFKSGDILKYNSLWKCGAHYDMQFFMVSHITRKGITMGFILMSHSETLEMDDTTITRRWTIGEVDSKKRRLPHPCMWKSVSSDEKNNGFVTVSCLN